MKDSEDPKGRRPSRKGGPTDGDPSRRSRASSGQPVRPRQAPHIPGTLSRDGSPKEMPPKKTAPKPTAARRQPGTPGVADRASTTRRAAPQRTGAKKTGRPAASPQKNAGTSRGRAPAGKAQRQSAPRRKLTPRDVELSQEEAAQRAKRKRLIFTAIAAVLVLAAIISVAVIVRGQLAQREEQIIAQAEDTSYEVVPCEPSMLDIEMRRTGSIAGYPMTFGLTMTNTSEQACSLDAGTEHLVLRVTSGNDPIWSSAHCPGGAESRMYVFGPGVSSTVNVEWSGARSTSSCQGGLPAPRPGTYVVEGSIDGVSFPQLRESFVLTDTAGIAPAPEPEEAEEPQTDETSEGEESVDPVTDETPPPDDYIPD